MGVEERFSGYGGEWRGEGEEGHFGVSVQVEMRGEEMREDGGVKEWVAREIHVVRLEKKHGSIGAAAIT